MKLVAEQIKSLRERRAVLLDKERELYNNLVHYNQREKVDCGYVYKDYQETSEHQRVIGELESIRELLLSSEFVVDRNFDFVDIGTAFYARYDGEDEVERMMLVDGIFTNSDDVQLVSSRSEAGIAAFGKKDGDRVIYRVDGGRTLSFTIDRIDRLSSSYVHFIREKEYSRRICDAVSSELRFLKKNNPEEYVRRFTLSPSQKYLIEEELCNREANLTPSRRSYLEGVIHSPIAPVLPAGQVGIGSIVGISLEDENGASTRKQFELINRAVSTEIDDQYVERITTLGNSIYGLHLGDTFKVRRKNQPSLNGVIESVYNDDGINPRVR